MATAQDVGRALNPLAVLGQIEGGIAQGLGLAVMEEIVQVDGQIRNASFTDYLLPTILDMPAVVATLVEEPDPQAPLGAKGVGEPPCISVTPASRSATPSPGRRQPPPPPPPPPRHRDSVGAWRPRAVPGTMSREIMSWDDFGVPVADVATVVADDGYEPDMILAIARGGLLIGGALGYALSVKNGTR